MPVTGPDFIALQVRDLERSSAFYETHLELRRAVVSPPHAIVFDTTPTAFAVREPLPGVDLDAIRPWAGAGVALWFASDDAQVLHDRLLAADVAIVSPPAPGPFGLMFSFSDPDGYVITVHDQA